MEYTPQTMDASVFEDWFPGANLNMSRLPDLPMIEAKYGKWKLKIPNLAILNENAVYVFEQLVNAASMDKDAKEVEFYIPSGEEYENKIQLITDICMAVKYEAKKRGTVLSGPLLVDSVHRKTADDGKKKLVFRLMKDNADAIYNYAQSVKEKTGALTLDLGSMIVAVAEAAEKRFENFVEEQNNA